MKKKLILPRGSALMVVLITITTLSSIVLATLLVVNEYAKGQVDQSVELEAELMAQRGIALGTHPKILRDDPLLEYVSEDGLESYRVTISSEASRININSILKKKDKRYLRNLFTYWQLDFDQASALTDAMIDWVDQDEVSELNGAEADVYLKLGYEDRPYNKNFRDLADLRLVQGFEELEKVKPDWQRYFTIWGDAELDIHEAPAELLAVAGEVDIDEAEQFVTRVVGEDGVLGTKDDMKFKVLGNALDALGVTNEETLRASITTRFRLGSRVRRVVSHGSTAETTKVIRIIVRESGLRPIILNYNEYLLERHRE